MKPRMIGLPVNTIALLDMEKRGQSTMVMCRMLGKFVDSIPKSTKDYTLLVSKHMFGLIKQNCPESIDRYSILPISPC